jgi:hypothetical protein
VKEESLETALLVFASRIQKHDDNWSKKHGMLALINTPGLARLRVTFDAKASRLRISLGASLLVDDG